MPNFPSCFFLFCSSHEGANIIIIFFVVIFAFLSPSIFHWKTPSFRRCTKVLLFSLEIKNPSMTTATSWQVDHCIKPFAWSLKNCFPSMQGCDFWMHMRHSYNMNFHKKATENTGGRRVPLLLWWAAHRGANISKKATKTQKHTTTNGTATHTGGANAGLYLCGLLGEMPNGGYQMWGQIWNAQWGMSDLGANLKEKKPEWPTNRWEVSDWNLQMSQSIQMHLSLITARKSFDPTLGTSNKKK